MMLVVRLPAVKNFEGLDNNSGFDRITAEIPSKWLKSSFGVGCWR